MKRALLHRLLAAAAVFAVTGAGAAPLDDALTATMAMRPVGAVRVIVHWKDPLALGSLAPALEEARKLVLLVFRKLQRG